jgi:hypothetical protein
MTRSHLGTPFRWLVVAVVLTTLTSTGCIGFTSQLIYWFKGGHKIDAEFPGLEEKKVAIICVANTSSYEPNSVPRMLERAVTLVLESQGEAIEVIHQDEVADWIDNNDWDQLDYREIGRGVEADMVLAIELEGFRLHEGMTLYKGRADVTITVFDMSEKGKVVFRKNIPDFAFPRTGARHSTEMSEARFRQLFVGVMAQEVAKYFYDYRIEDDFGGDARSLAE